MLAITPHVPDAINLEMKTHGPCQLQFESTHRFKL